LLHDGVELAAGVDPDRRSLSEHRAPKLRRVAGLAEHLPFSDESFDLVMCSCVLEHLVRPRCAFVEVARVLRSPDPVLEGSGGHFVFLAPNAWHPLTWASRLLSWCGDWQARLVKGLYSRAEADTFPVFYRANTRRQVEQLAAAVGLVPVAIYAIGDPTYLAFNELFFRLATVAEGLTPKWMKVHLVGDFVKGQATQMCADDMWRA
jgi:SAM-dependent methyltransferase